VTYRKGIIMKSAKRRQRLRGTCKWGGVTLCVLLFALWLASRWYMIFLHTPASSGGDLNYLSVAGGLGSVVVIRNNTSEVLYVMTDRNSVVKAMEPRNRGWSWWPRSQSFRYPGVYRFHFPLWLPFLLIALPTGFLFWSDHRRRMRAGCCSQCGYSLTGNQSGKCPECGATTARAAT